MHPIRRCPKGATEMTEPIDKRAEFLHLVFSTVKDHPDWYADLVATAGLAFTDFKKGLEAQVSYTQLALSFLPQKEAQKLTKTINRETWPKPIQDIIDFRAEGKDLKDL